MNRFRNTLLLVVLVGASWEFLFADELAPLASSQATRSHWAYRMPRRPDLPLTKNRHWPRNPVDRFILARLEHAGIAPSPAADKATLARRLTLALTQLPVELETLDEFLADSQPDAAERLVDRLLASPRYGERMAQPWLDLARYADTHGYHADTHREMWRWRDWVIDSFNRGQAYDEFLVEQLAGDLLPSPSLDQQLATGLLRNHMIIFENGVVDEEYRVEYVMDRVTTFASIALGQTLACARCHDHKHDPFTQEDFYRLFAYFNNVPEKGVDGEHGNAVPFILAPTPLQQMELNRLDSLIDEARRYLDRRLTEAAPGQELWERTARPGRAAAPRDAWLQLSFDEGEAGLVKNRADESTAIHVAGTLAHIPGRQDAALLFDGQTWLDVASPPRESRTAGWSLGATVFPTVDATLTVAARLAGSPTRRGWEFQLEQRRPTLRIYGPEKSQALLIQSRGAVALRKWQQVSVVVAVERERATVQIYVDGQPQETTVSAAGANEQPALDPTSLAEALRAAGPVRIGRSGDDHPFRGAIDELWMFDRGVTRDEAVTLGGSDPLADWLAIPVARRTPEQSHGVRRRFLADLDPQFLARETQWRDWVAERDRLRRTLPTSMVMREMPQPRPTFVLHRGRFDDRGPHVSPDVPRWLTPSLQKPVANRLELARWLTRDDHPLTARVAANRFWQWHFGHGLVRTPDDFGTRGAAPSHPELLDWLAIELQGSPGESSWRWDVKRFQRLLLTSATFHQSATPAAGAGASAGEHDVDNLRLSRGPHSRLSAETIRDQALAVAGLLDRRGGGAGVFPYQPAGLWEELAYDPQQFTAQTYRQSHGADLYRRSLYTFWKRAAPPPSLSAFDAPDREVCTAMRPTSNTPQQALVLMNDPTFLEAACRLSDRIGAQARWTPRVAVRTLFRTVLARWPTDDETKTLEAAFHAERAEFARDRDAADRLLGVGESPSSVGDDRVPDAVADPAARAALACVAHLVLSLDETVTLP